jgi:hypothetical protein
LASLLDEYRSERRRGLALKLMATYGLKKMFLPVMLKGIAKGDVGLIISALIAAVPAL